MRPRHVFVALAILALLYLVLTWPDGGGGLGDWLRPEPTPPPTVCDNFEFQALLPLGSTLRSMSALDSNDDGENECVVLYGDPSQTSGPIYGAVYHAILDRPIDPEAGVFPVSDMHRYELKTDFGRPVEVCLVTRSDMQFRVLSMDADTRAGSELVILCETGGEQLVGLTAFRWLSDKRRYQLVGYAHGDWLETEPDPVTHYVDKVVVCDRQYPADASQPDRASGSLFLWKNGKLERQSNYSGGGCNR